MHASVSWQVGAIPALVHADTSDEDNAIGNLSFVISFTFRPHARACAGAGSFGKRSLRKEAISSDEEGPRPPPHNYHR